MKEVETLIVGQLLNNPDFAYRVSTHLRPELFQHEEFRLIYSAYKDFQDKYKDTPNEDAIRIALKEATGVSEEALGVTLAIVDKMDSEAFKAKLKAMNADFVLDKTQRYLTDRACYLAIMESLQILDPQSKSKKKPEMIPDLLRKALSIAFDEEFGHDYLGDAAERFDAYQTKVNKIPFSLAMMNKVTDDGMPRKSLFLMSAATGQGKSLFLTDQSVFWLLEGYNVLYISLEMSEHGIAQRADAKLLNVDINKIKSLPKETYLAKMREVSAKKKIGKLKVKQYAPGSFHANHLRTLLQELKQKEGFVPDCVVVDYLGIMASYRVKADMGSYTLMKFIAEELRGVAVDFDCCIYSATQVNRGGVNNADPDLTNMADSMGIAHTADVIMIMAGTPELEACNLVRIIQAKNRYGSMTPGSFVVGIDRAKMTLFDSDLPSNNFQASTPPNTPTKTPIKVAGLPAGKPSKTLDFSKSTPDDDGVLDEAPW